MYKLNNGVEIPEIGFGTWKITDPATCVNSVKEALKIGYRHIDTAAVYGNEEWVGEGIQEFLKESNVKREEIFLVTKVWNSEQGYEKTLAAFNESLKRLKVEYIDMYLVHWPQPFNLEVTWECYRALETLYKEGKVRAIGVCNMKEHHLQHIIDNFTVVPAVNQVELHPKLQQPELVHFCETHGIILEAWSPLMQGALDEPTLLKIGERHKKSVAQVVLKWHLQKGFIPLPKSVTSSRIAENFSLDFFLSPDEMERIGELDIAERIGPDPDEIKF